jgi:uncharacterized protein YndB with AHSA1/START domain
MSTRPSLTLQRRLNASPGKVFRAWTQPAQILKWMHPSGNEMIHAEVDAREGGSFRLVMRDQHAEGWTSTLDGLERYLA